MTIYKHCPDTLAQTFSSRIPHLHQNFSCLGSGVDQCRFMGNDTAEELLTPLLRQLNFWCESGMSHLNTLNATLRSRLGPTCRQTET